MTSDFKKDNTLEKQFHHFIQVSDKKTKQAEKLPEFQYMQQTIRKSYKQLKKNKSDKHTKVNEKFMQYFKTLQKQEQIKFYQYWIKQLQAAIQSQYMNKERKQQRNLLKKQGQAYIKKSIINKWQKKSIKLQNLSFTISQSKKQKVYPLQFYIIRKSKNKQRYGWVLQVINDDVHIPLKTVHCGVKNQKDFQQWFDSLEKAIQFSRIYYFRKVVLGISQSQFQTPPEREDIDQLRKTKTLTQLVIDNQMKNQDICELQQIIEQVKMQKQQENIDLQSKGPGSAHPNVFQRLFPSINLSQFTQNNPSMTLLQNGLGYRLFQMIPSVNEQFRLRINIMLPFNKSLVFKALNQQINLWNNQIDIFSIKTKISSQNSALIYQKDKAQGLLYRERDYLYFRHCFSKKPSNSSEKNKIFIVDKSIDSLSFPPFMTVARGEKQLIWCIYGNQDEKQTMLILQGQIKGGGYMNSNNDKEMTIKFFKKIVGLQSYLIEKKFMTGNQKIRQTVFEENWEVAEPEQQFFDISDQNESSFESNQSNAKQQKANEKNNRKFSSTSDQQHTQFDEFMKKTSQQNLEQKQIQKLPQPATQQNAKIQKIYSFTAPQFDKDRLIIIPQNFIKVHHDQKPLQKKTSQFFPHYRGHHLWKGQWAISTTGGLNYVDQQKMNQQKKVLTFIIKRIGRNILSGKGILNISLPVDIFCRQSNIQRLAASFGFAPVFLQKAALLSNPIQQLKYVIATGNFSSLIYLTMQKPFNPILGQTYQSWIDGCPIYFQQISHHPPVASYLMIGRGYRMSGTLQAKMDLSINSGTGINQGIFMVEFQNGSKFYYTTAAGELSGLTYGQRKLLFVGKNYFWNVQQGLFLEIQFNPSSKNRRFFGGSNNLATGDALLHDFFQGTLKKYKKQDIQQHLLPKKGDFRKIMAIPKSCPTAQPLSELYKVTGKWTKSISFNGEKMFDIDENRYHPMKDEQNPLASNSNYREDVVYRRLNDFVSSQQFKEVLQIQQRKDKKLRQTELKNKK